jgi:hypothetical protein
MFSHGRNLKIIQMFGKLTAALRQQRSGGI